MQLDRIPDDVRSLAFDFFYWFSRFEYALKATGYLKDDTPGANAEVGWPRFVKTFEGGYTLTPTAEALIALNPQRQIVPENGDEFRDVGFEDKPSDLEKVLRLAKTVRNNLFHGGKHGVESWDNPDRMRKLLPTTIALLDELAALAGFEEDYSRYY